MSNPQPLDLVPVEATTFPIPLRGRVEYQIGYKRKRFFLFGRIVTKWRVVSRSYFYSALMATGWLSERTDFESADILFAGGYRLAVGPYSFRVMPA